MMQIYGVEISESTITRITDKVWPLVQEWRTRPLDAVYPFVWLDAIHFKVRKDGRVVPMAVYCVIGVNNEGYKSLLGMYLGESGGVSGSVSVVSGVSGGVSGSYSRPAEAARAASGVNSSAGGVSDANGLGVASSDGLFIGAERGASELAGVGMLSG